MAQDYLASPRSWRLVNLAQNAYDMPFTDLQNAIPHESHPPLANLMLLVFGAVLEVVCVSLPGYIIARLGHFDADKQKFLANLNVQLFTPCLIFTKLASQLNANKLVELGIIPIIFVIQTLVSWMVAVVISKCFGFNKRASNFVTAMGVFGNSNSLPISLVLSLSQTLKGLHWDRIPGDTDDEVAARGILYLLIFQQLGQLVRWSWGYHILLAPKDKYPEYSEEREAEEGRYVDEAEQERAPLIGTLDGETAANSRSPSSSNLSRYEPDGSTPVANRSRVSLAEPESGDEHLIAKKGSNGGLAPVNSNGHQRHYHDSAIEEDDDHILSFPRIRNSDDPEVPEGVKGFPGRAKLALSNRAVACRAATASFSSKVFNKLPHLFQVFLSEVGRLSTKTAHFVWDFMNPPLWAMLFAVVVASVPSLQQLFFEEDSFVKTSVTNAIQSSGNVAVPLILVVLGANLARNTHKSPKHCDPEEELIGRKLLIASVLSRMVLPVIIMAPVLALFAKYVPVSILDDPIFVVVCFLLIGAPSALQLAQICQINEVYEGVMSNILFQSYVVWILPSTLVLVMCALEVVEWALM